MESRESVLKILEEHSRGVPLEREAVEKCVDAVTKSIRGYNDKEALKILKNFTNLCIEQRLHTAKAKMHRNLAMSGLFTNNIEMAVEMMETAISEFQHQKNYALLGACYSDLGLIHFCNHDYVKARELYEKAEALLPSAPDTERRTVYNLYYRKGLLCSNSMEYIAARQHLEKAIEYADAKSDLGLAIMNIGITYKRDRDYEKACEYYNKALETFEKDDYLNRSATYNNLASLHMTFGQLDTALKYINMAFECLDNRDMTQLFIYFETYTELNALTGEAEKSIDKFIEMLSSIRDFYMYKSVIIESINSLAIAVDENKKLLEKLEAVVAKLIESTANTNTEYKRELEKCLENIRLYIADADRLSMKGGIILEKENY